MLFRSNVCLCIASLGLTLLPSFPINASTRLFSLPVFLSFLLSPWLPCLSVSLPPVLFLPSQILSPKCLICFLSTVHSMIIAGTPIKKKNLSQLSKMINHPQRILLKIPTQANTHNTIHVYLNTHICAVFIYILNIMYILLIKIYLKKEDFVCTQPKKTYIYTAKTDSREVW